MGLGRRHVGAVCTVRRQCGVRAEVPADRAGHRRRRRIALWIPAARLQPIYAVCLPGPRHHQISYGSKIHQFNLQFKIDHICRTFIQDPATLWSWSVVDA